MIRHLQKRNRIICTSRNYREVVALAKLKRMRIEFVGKHGGVDRTAKLDASLDRMRRLSGIIQKFGPDITISFCSPEAARISYGLGIRHIAFCDSPHAEAVMRLSVPLVQKLLVPWLIPKKEFTKFGIDRKDIIPYRAVDASVIVKHTKLQKRKTRIRKNILIRVEEEQASYAEKGRARVPEIIENIASRFADHNVLVLPRYRTQITALRKKFGSRVKILDRVVIGGSLLQDVDVFVGSGGTMTAEAALLGVPTISYNAVPNLVQDYLVRKKLILLQSDPGKIAPLVARMLHSENRTQSRAKSVMSSMEDPLAKLVRIIQS